MSSEHQAALLGLASLALASALGLAMLFTPAQAPPAVHYATVVNTDVRLVRTIPTFRWALWCERFTGPECR